MNHIEFTLEVKPDIPKSLSHLKIFSENLSYSWNRKIRLLFYRLDPQLWEQCNHNPKVLLRRVAQEKLEKAAADAAFMKDYKRAVAWYAEHFENAATKSSQKQLGGNDMVAYFSAEFGLHESLPVYSGGLGILAGDHCKSISNLNIPFTAVGLLYHEGYFTQNINGEGQQIAEYRTHHFEDLPIEPVRTDDGKPLLVSIDCADRTIQLRIWRARIGQINLYLLDSDVPQNNEKDRLITYRLYGGDQTTRIQQEMVLGIGGVRTLRALGVSPNVWHINEGHSAFQIVERLCEYIEQGLDYPTALELVASNTTFTTHTPVPAGHDIFGADLIQQYLMPYIKKLGIPLDDFLRLGNSPHNSDRLNMTSLALRCSRFHNGVSRIHGSVASEMESYIWPEIRPEDNPISYVTNGVHVSTFLAQEWANLFDANFRNWRNELLNPDFWNCIDTIDDRQYWSLHQTLRSYMLQSLYKRTVQRYRRNGSSESQINKVTQYLQTTDRDILILGFARRFATYKRATLLFAQKDRLKKLLNNPERPVMLVFAGKAHPKDEPGQELIKIIHQYTQDPDFIGKIILLENYDMSLSRKLVTGVDVWINTPEYPLEACGTSGQKAGINGVLNLSVLDGWWGEGYNGKNGWAVIPHSPKVDPVFRNQEEANDLIGILEQQIIPAYFDRNDSGYSGRWIQMCKASMKSIIPQFNSDRMVMDYVNHYYSKAAQHHKKITENKNSKARELAAWKQKIHAQWKGVSLQLIGQVPVTLGYQEKLNISIQADLNQLSAEDVRIELQIGEKQSSDQAYTVHEKHLFHFDHVTEDKKAIFRISLNMENCGLHVLTARVYPYHELLAHPLEMGYMKML